MKLRLIFWGALCAIITGFLLWKNNKKYPEKSIYWKIFKSCIEIIILLVSALRVPVLLVSWCSVWLMRPVKTTWAKATFGTLVGIILGFLAFNVMEILLILSVFSIDDITGEDYGVLKHYRRAKSEI